MRARTCLAALALAAGLPLTGCVDARGRITAESIQAFWQQFAPRPLALVPEPGLWGAVGRPRPQGPPRGTLLARREADRMDVEVFLTNLPPDAETVATGLKLRDGEPVAPTSVAMETVTLPRDDTRPRADFAFDEAAPKGAGGGRPTVCLRVTYALDRAVSADGASFTLVLGEPDGAVACRMGVSSAVSIRDGGPTLTGCVRTPVLDGFDGPPLPPAPPSSTPTVCFRFRETPDGSGGESLVRIVPSVEAVLPHGPARPATETAGLIPPDVPAP